MSIWNLFVKKNAIEVEAGECAPSVNAIEKQTIHDSVRPFEAECITGVKTYRGVQHGFEKPQGRYRQVAKSHTRQTTPISGVQAKTNTRNTLRGTGT